LGGVALLVLTATVSGSEAQEARIGSIVELETASVVLVNAGYEQGFRRGMKLSVESGESCIGELLVVDTTGSTSVAMITSIEENRILNQADTVRIKTFQFAASWK
jgi:hypothetical protein